ncbi:MAG: hypothetical protein AB8G99_22610, partial [Planctomycetaceae bacterium]
LSASNVDVEDEVAVDRWMYDRAKSNIRSDPSSFVAACVVRVRRLWNFTPLVEQQSRVVTWAMRVFYVVVFFGVVLSALRRSPDGVRWYFLVAGSMLLAFTLVHLLYWSNTRMRAPLMVPIALLSARGWVGFRSEPKESVADTLAGVG